MTVKKIEYLILEKLFEERKGKIDIDSEDIKELEKIIVSPIAREKLHEIKKTNWQHGQKQSLPFNDFFQYKRTGS